MKLVVLIKFGGSLITDKTRSFTSKPGTIRRLCLELARARKKTGKLIIIGNGGGSFPHQPAVEYRTAEGMINRDSFRGIAVVQDAAARLNRIIVAQLLRAGENAITLNPSSFMITENGEIKKAFLVPILKLLESKMLPVVYGDVGLDEEKGCCILSTEKILNYLALKLKQRGYLVEKIILAGITDGVYDSRGKTISKLTPEKFSKFKKEIGVSDGIDVTGGMIHKVEQAMKLAKKGIETLIIDGKTTGNLKKAILDQEVKGTLIKK
jgi:isopentenyl phosphate kinase